MYMYVGVYEKCVKLRNSIQFFLSVELRKDFHVSISVTEHLVLPSRTLKFWRGMVWE
jgi:hypothetical protein